MGQTSELHNDKLMKSKRNTQVNWVEFSSLFTWWWL